MISSLMSSFDSVRCNVQVQASCTVGDLDLACFQGDLVVHTTTLKLG